MVRTRRSWTRRIVLALLAIVAIAISAILLLYVAGKGWLGSSAKDWLWIQKSRLAFDHLYSTPNPPFSLKPTPFLVHAAGGVRPGNALDIAAGQGRNSLYLAQQGWQVTAFDISEKGLEALRRNAAQAGVTVETVRATAQEFDYGTAKWDLVLLAYAPIPYHDAALLRRLKDSIRPGGLLVVEVPVGMKIDSPGNLDKGELRQVFGGMKIVEYSERDGVSEWFSLKVPIARMIATK